MTAKQSAKRPFGYYSSKLPDHVRLVAIEVAKPIVGPVKVAKGHLPSGVPAYEVRFAKYTSKDEDWNAKNTALRDVGLAPDVLHTYGAYVVSSAFIGHVTWVPTDAAAATA